MSQYAPTSRRPIAAEFRRTANAATQFCVRHGIHPDTISYLSVVAAFAAAICFRKAGEIRWLLMVALHIGAWLALFLGGQSFASSTILDWTCLVVIGGSIQTMVVRLKRITAALQDKR